MPDLMLWPKSYADALQLKDDIINLALHEHPTGVCNCLFFYPCPSCGKQTSLVGEDLTASRGTTDGICDACHMAAAADRAERKFNQ